MRYLTHFLELRKKYKVKWRPCFTEDSRVKYQFDWDKQCVKKVLYSPLPTNQTKYMIFLHELGHWVMQSDEKERLNVNAWKKHREQNVMHQEIEAWEFALDTNKYVDYPVAQHIATMCLNTYIRYTDCSYTLLLRYNMWLDFSEIDTTKESANE